MELLGGKSYDDGIDFLVKDEEKKFVVSARRNSCGEIETSIKQGYTWGENNSRGTYIISAVVAVIFSLLYCLFKSQTVTLTPIIGWLIVLVLFWIWLIGGVYLDSKDPQNASTFRYHSAEHKVLNFYDRYSKIPQTVSEIANLSNLSVRCGSTLIVVVSVFGSLSLLCIVALPFKILKILGVLLSAFATLILWARGKCNLIQKLSIKPPTEDELELAICAMKRLVEDENMV